MASIRPKAFALLCGAGVLAGCVSTPPPQTPLEGVGHTAANTAPRGTPEFCRRYAGQSFTETYRQTANTSQPGTTAARMSGEEAYRRCLEGRTN